MNSATVDDPITTLPVSQILNVSQDRVRQLERVGKLRARRTSTGIRLFSRADVELILRRAGAPPPPPQVRRHPTTTPLTCTRPRCGWPFSGPGSSGSPWAAYVKSIRLSAGSPAPSAGLDAGLDIPDLNKRLQQVEYRQAVNAERADRHAHLISHGLILRAAGSWVAHVIAKRDAHQFARPSVRA